jgi:hypothetical protein
VDIPFRGQFDKTTYFKAFALASRPEKKRLVLPISAAILLVAILIALVVMFFTKDSQTNWDVARLAKHAIWTPIMLFFLLKPLIGPYFTANRLWKDPIVRLPVSGSASELGIRYMHLASHPVEIGWNRFVKKAVTDDLIVLLTVDGALSILPHGFFDNQQDWEMMKNLIKSRIVEPK